MSDGFVRLYQRGWDAARAEQRVASLDRAGLRLGHPLTGRITVLTEDGQVELDRAALLASLAEAGAGDGLLFQYWLHDASSPHLDVACIVGSERPGLVSEDYAVDGLTREEQDRVFRMVFEEFERTGDAVALLADRRGSSAEVDWADLLDGGATKAEDLPSLLVLPAEVVPEHPELADLEFRRLGSFLLHDRDGVTGR